MTFGDPRHDFRRYLPSACLSVRRENLQVLFGFTCAENMHCSVNCFFPFPALQVCREVQFRPHCKEIVCVLIPSFFLILFIYLYFIIYFLRGVFSFLATFLYFKAGVCHLINFVSKSKQRKYTYT